MGYEIKVEAILDVELYHIYKIITIIIIIIII